MPTLKDFVVMYGEEMGKYTQFNTDLARSEEYNYHYGAPSFGLTMWQDMARELRGLPLLYDDYEEFWSDFVPWWKQRGIEFARIYLTAAVRFNILHNYDRTESNTEKTKSSANEKLVSEDFRSGQNEATQKQSAQDSTTTAGTVKDITLATETTVEKVNGFNSPDEELSTKGQTIKTLDDVKTSNSDNATTGESNANSTAKAKHSENGTAHGSKDSAGTVETVREMRMFGNIGVTTSQQMLMEERRLMNDHVIGYIVKEFKLAFCLLVY